MKYIISCQLERKYPEREHTVYNLDTCMEILEAMDIFVHRYSYLSVLVKHDGEEQYYLVRDESHETVSFGILRDQIEKRFPEVSQT